MLTAVLFEAERERPLAATDSYRLAVRTLDWSLGSDEPMTALVPARAITEAARALAGEAHGRRFGIEPHQVTFAGRRPPAHLATGRGRVPQVSAA